MINQFIKIKMNNGIQLRTLTPHPKKYFFSIKKFAKPNKVYIFAAQFR